MTTGMTVYNAPNAVPVIEMMGRAIARSQFIKCENVEQGIVLAMTCYSKGMDFLTLAQKYDLIGGRLSMKASAMISGLRERGGKHKIIKRTPDEACVLLIYDGQEYESRLTWEDAQKETFPYKGKEEVTLRFIEAGNQKELAKVIKSKYATPRSRMQMLWARVVSDGVEAICPEVKNGMYTPEEVGDFTDGKEAIDTDFREVAPDSGAAAAAPVALGEVPPVPAAVGSPVAAEIPGLATGEQIAEINEAFRALKLDPAEQLALIKHNGGVDMGSLPAAGAERLVGILRRALIGTESPDTPVESVAVERCSEELSDRLKAALRSASQLEGNGTLGPQLRDKMTAAGFQKFTQIEASICLRMLEFLEDNKVGALMSMDLGSIPS